MTGTKRPWASKTVWFNTAAIVLMVLESREFTAIVPDDLMPTVAAVVAVINVVLRGVTNTGVSLK